jgi:hypothetical protein
MKPDPQVEAELEARGFERLATHGDSEAVVRQRLYARVEAELADVVARCEGYSYTPAEIAETVAVVRRELRAKADKELPRIMESMAASYFSDEVH